ncbi:MAG: OmpH family outer membrane protein [Bacteroidia bacterium]|nr:OmpH family outer membrane protein [Bacteroidia bacterium]
MKKIFLTAALIATTGLVSMAQKFAYVDSEYILGQVPEYKTAQGQLDALSLQWQKEVEAKYTDIDKMYKAYQAEQVLLSEDMKRKREDDIIAKEKEAKDIQKAHFGVEGDLFKKRQELVKPIQDKIYNAIKEMAEKTQLKIIFDKGSELNMIFADPKLDKSDDVLVLMGYKKKTIADKK